MRETTAIFLSSTSDDLGDCRAKVREMVSRMRQTTVAMETWGAQPTKPLATCKCEVEASDALILIVGHRYGWVPSREDGGDGSRSITWWEVDWALEHGIPIFAFLLDETAPAIGPREQDRLLTATSEHEFIDVGHAVRRLRKFRDYIAQQATFEHFASAEDLATKVVTSLHRWLLSRVAERAEALGTPVLKNLPGAPLPSNDLFVGRSDLLNLLAEQITAAPSGARFALWGTFGVGLTQLALRTLSDPRVSAAFSSFGWAPIGRDLLRERSLMEWAEGLGLSPASTTQGLPVAQRINTLKRLVRGELGDARVLVLVDDAPDVVHGEDHVLPGNSVHLITTHSRDVAELFADPGRVTRVSELNSFHSIELLCHYAPRAKELPRRELEELATKVGYLPFAIRLAGKHLNAVLESEFPSNSPYVQRRVNTLLSGRLGNQELMETIDFYVNLLSTSDQITLGKLSIFPPKPSSFSHEAALAVCGGIDDTFDNLLKKGFVDIDPDKGRYALHPVVAEHAADALTMVPAVRTGAIASMVIFYADYTSQNRHNHSMLAKEFINIGAAARLALSSPDLGEHLIRGANACSDYLLSRGMYRSGSEFLEPALAIAKGFGEYAARETALNLANHLEKLGDFSRVEEILEPYTRTTKEGDEKEVISVAQAYHLRSVVVFNLGNHEESNHLIEAGHAILDGLLSENEELLGPPSSPVLAEAWRTRCDLLERQSINSTAVRDWKQAERCGIRGLTIARRIGDSTRRATHLRNLAWYYQDRGRLSRASKIAWLGYNWSITAGHVELQIGFQHRLGKIALARYKSATEIAEGNVTLEDQLASEAERHLRAAHELSEQIGHRWYQALVWHELGWFHLATANMSEAQKAFETSVAIARQLKAEPLIRNSTWGLDDIASLRDSAGDCA